jgi:hypothetical protein
MGQKHTLPENSAIVKDILEKIPRNQEFRIIDIRVISTGGTVERIFTDMLKSQTLPSLRPTFAASDGDKVIYRTVHIHRQQVRFKFDFRAWTTTGAAATGDEDEANITLVVFDKHGQNILHRVNTIISTLSVEQRKHCLLAPIGDDLAFTTDLSQLFNNYKVPAYGLLKKYKSDSEERSIIQSMCYFVASYHAYTH